MRIETERMKEREATAELIRRLVRDNALRGEFMILSDEADDENFVQVACDYDDAGGKSDGCFDLEYRAGHGSPLFHCTRRVGADDVERVFLDFLEGRVGWRQDFRWDQFAATCRISCACKCSCAVTLRVDGVSLNMV